MAQYAVVRDNLRDLKSWVMKIWLRAYIWTLSNMTKTDFQNLHFKGGLPITRNVKIRSIIGCHG